MYENSQVGGGQVSKVWGLSAGGLWTLESIPRRGASPWGLGTIWGKEKQRKAMTLARCLIAWAHTWVGWLCVLFSLLASPLSLMQNLPQSTISVPAWVPLRTKCWSAPCQDVRTWR